MDDLALIVPVRAFSSGKSRLSERLASEDRTRLARALAEVVVDPRHSLPTYVVCDDWEVATWATERGAQPVMVTARGLNDSLEAARPEILRGTTARWIAVVHADLPLADRLGDILEAIVAEAGRERVAIVTDGHGDGTNVIVFDRDVFEKWRFLYGPGSCAAHADQARHLGLQVELIASADLELDLDTSRDLDDARLGDFLAIALPGWSNQ